MVVSLRLNTDNADRLRYFQKKKEEKRSKWGLNPEQILYWITSWERYQPR